MDFTEDQITRYARHIILPEIGGNGQARLLEARVLVVGAGGLGSPLLLYLAAAGVGRLGIVDDDRVDLSNLQRQVIHDTTGLGRLKAESAATRIHALNPDVVTEIYTERLTAANALNLVTRYDIIADGSDNFATRFLLNDACHFAHKTLVSAAILRFDGQLTTFKSHLKGGHPCYRCLFREPPSADTIPSCSQAGVLGAMAGTIGTMQATEVLKEILGIGDSLSGQLLMVEVLGNVTHKISVRPDPDCPLCGLNPTILDLSPHMIPVEATSGVCAV